jgi:AcrR family transcriptional regulator
MDLRCTDRYAQRVPRLPDPAKREQLLRDVVEYLQRRGIADLSLAPLAEAVGTSKRMLLYYFTDRSTLLAEALASTRPDVAEIFKDVQDTAGLRTAARDLWWAITRGDQRRSIRMLLQVLSLAPTQPEIYGTFSAEAVHIMVNPIAAALERLGFGSDQAAAKATLLVSGLRGLCQDMLVTGDEARIDAAAELVITAATSGAPN